MKNKLLTLVAALFMTCLYANAQPFELGLSTGTSVNGTCQIDIGADMAYIFSIAGGLDMGIGAGLKFARPIYKVTHNDRFGRQYDEREYANELAVPFFGRIRYSIPNGVFFQADAGYRIALVDLVWWFPGWNLSGEYFEPQVGYRLDTKRSLSIGASLQHCPCRDHITTESGSGESYIMTGQESSVKIWRPVAFIKYSITL